VRTIDPTGTAELLYKAARTRTPVPPLTDSHPDMTVADAYAVQTALCERLLADGDRVVGYKLGLTSAPMQQMFGVDEPDYAPVLASGVVDDGGVVDCGRFIQPKAEAEIALVLDRPLTGPGVTALEAARAVAGATAAIEIVDSRIQDWKIKLPDTIADMASSGAVVLSSRLVPLEEVDVRLVGMMVSRNGQLAGTGAGAAALGNPVRALSWLANTLAPYGVTLEAGRFVMTGALHAAFPAGPGDVVRAEFDRLGSVTVRMV
jgi:2-keto-4-pentenoate hydratase